MAQGNVHLQRSDTTKRPYLSIDPVDFSLTEGTSIPAPPPLPTPASATRYAASRTASSSEKDNKDSPSYAGPLSSHPVTPIDNNGEGPSHGFPFGRADTNMSSSLARPQSAGNDLDKTVSQAHAVRQQQPQQPELTHHQHNNVPNGTTPYTASTASGVSPPSDDQRRSSLASRFMRLRSISSLKRFASGSKSNLNSSNTSLSHQPSSSNLRHQYMDQDSGYGTTGASVRASGDRLRGKKRPGSPGLDNDSDMGPPKAGRSRANSASFPRLMRKKSMEWFGTARRKSGMWAGTEERRPLDISSIDDEPQENGVRSMDKDSRVSESNYGDGASQLGRDSSVMQYREPPPTINEFGDFGGYLDGQAMFATIGR
ncbi:MAG: hypothetical protein M1828_002560 [Chrysothrix sp. TS-e1954]|nr:MAG: hypothetical protein M1828_002560 [Chrysothrix sp. TS-e1954]